jgi:hypothetical protein
MARHALTILGCIIALATLAAAEAATPFATAQAVERPTVTVEVRGGGFHWGDAAIGGLVVVGIVIAAAGVALTIKRPHNPGTDWRSH